MAARAPVVAAGGVVVATGPRVLLVQRRTQPLVGQWSLPGGKVHAGESIRDAVEREVFEETGLRVLAGALVDVVEVIRDDFHYVIHDHLCTAIDPSQSPRAGDDASDVRWARPSDLPALGVTEAVARVVMRALAMRQTCLEDE